MNELIEVCKPLFQSTNISFMECVRFNHATKTTKWLSTNPIRTQLLFTQTTYDSIVLLFNEIKSRNYHYYHWDSGVLSLESNLERRKLQNYLAISESDFRISHGFVIADHRGDYSNIYSFGTTPENESIKEFYINNLGMLSNFIFSLKEKIKDIFDQPHLAESIQGPESCQKSLILDFNVKRYYLDSLSYNTKKNYVTSQEMKSLLLIAKGYTIKEVAHALALSSRTIEYYLNSAKKRLNLSTNQQLISCFWDSALVRLMALDIF